MKKNLIALLLIAIIALAPLSAFADDEVVTLTFESLAWIKAEQDATAQVIADWNAANPKIQVQLVQGSWSDINTALLTGFETGDVPDMFHYWMPPIMTWKENGWLADLSPMLDADTRADVDEGVWGALTSKDGKVVALPFQHECDVTFYNKDLFDKAGITPPTVDKPWTLDELIENCKKMTDPENGVYGLQIKGLWDYGSRYFNDIWATKINEQPIMKDDSGNYAINFSDNYKTLMEKMRNLMLVDKIVPPFAGGTEDTDTPLFLDNKLAVYTGIGCWQRSQFLEDDAFKGVNWGMMPAVVIDNANNYGAIQTISVTEASKHKEESMEFLKYFWSTENQVKICGAAYIFPARKSALAAPEINEASTGWDVAQLSAKSLVVPEYITVPGWGDFSETVGKTIYGEYFQGLIDMDEFVNRATLEGNQMLEDARS